MKILSKMLATLMIISLILACKETKKEDQSAVDTTVKKAESVEAELENITKTLEKEAEDLDKSLDALDDI